MSSSTPTARRSLDKLVKVNGRVITPEDPAYDQARTVFYGGIDKRPTAIVRVSDVADVRRVISIARDEGYELAVRSGGHSVVGHSTTDGGLVIDLRAMSRIDVDARTAWVETGATALQVTEVLAEHGLVVGFGDSGSVGVGGITLGGGIGFLVRKLGMTIDSLLAAEVVTADGRHLRADAQHQADLFWALRGGGGNFGAVTRLQFRLHGLKQFTGVEGCQVRAERGQRNHIGCAIRAFVRLGYHRFTTGVSWFAAKVGIIRDAVRAYLANPRLTLPEATA